MQKEINGKASVLELPVEIHWGTVSRLIVDIIESKNAIRSVLYDPRIVNHAKLGTDSERFRNNLYRDDDFWDKLFECRSLIWPFANAIEKIEGDRFIAQDAYYYAVRRSHEAFPKWPKARKNQDDPCFFPSGRSL
uniref:Uncharacterized protein n=1 Tax=Acrobeloides nanus TaxID=290746 RepID=A0A914E9I1_9BILA